MLERAVDRMTRHVRRRELRGETDSSRPPATTRRPRTVLATSPISEKARHFGVTFPCTMPAKVVLTATAADMFRSRTSLLAELALLRHQLTVLQRSVARPRVTWFDRIALVALAAITPTRRSVLRIVQPENASSLAPRRFQASPSTSAITTPHALTRGSASRPPCPPSDDGRAAPRSLADPRSEPREPCTLRAGPRPYRSPSKRTLVLPHMNSPSMPRIARAGRRDAR